MREVSCAYSWDLFEVGLVIPASILISPEFNRHRRERASYSQLSRGVNNVSTVVVDYVYIHSESGALDLSRIHWQYGDSEGEASVDLGTTGDRGQVDVSLNFSVNVVGAGDGKRGAGGGDQAQFGKTELLLGLNVGLFQRGQIAGAKIVQYATNIGYYLRPK